MTSIELYTFMTMLMTLMYLQVHTDIGEVKMKFLFFASFGGFRYKFPTFTFVTCMRKQNHR